MSDTKKAEEQKPIQDETLDEVSGGYVNVPRNPVTGPHFPPGGGNKPPSDPRPHGEPC